MDKKDLKDNFIHFHVHNSFSFKDGVGTPESRVNYAVKTGKPAVATSNHGNVADWISIYQKAHANGIKPILGCEFYFSRTAKELEEALKDNSKKSIEIRKKYRSGINHVTMFAKNLIGYYNMIQIHNDAWINRFYMNPITSPDFIEKHAEGVICFSGCASSEQNKMIGKKYYLLSDQRLEDHKKIIKEKTALMKKAISNESIEIILNENIFTNNDVEYFNNHQSFKAADYIKFCNENIKQEDEDEIKNLDKKIEEAIDWWHKTFKENYYIELMVIDYPLQAAINSELIQYAKKKNIPVILTNDAHYVSKVDADVQMLQMLSNQKKTLKDVENNNAWTIKTKELFYKSVDELHEAWEEWHKNDVFTEDIFWQAVENTIKLAESVENFKIDTSVKLPKLYDDSMKVFAKKIAAGMKKRGINEENLGELYDFYKKRVSHEVKIIKEKGYIDYFLIVDDIIQWTKNKFGRYSVGAGRGCFVPQSKVKLLNGDFKNIEDVEYDDKVITAWGDKQNVKSKYEYDIDEEISNINLENGDVIECTQDHKILVVKKDAEKKIENAVWIKSSEIEEGDFLIKNIDN